MVDLSQFLGGNYLKNSQASFFVRAVGTGKPLLIVHGGPGLDHTYLVKWLAPLAEYRTLVYYDQSGCGRDRTPPSDVTFETTVEQLQALVEALELADGFSLLTHSWGSNIVLSALATGKSCRPTDVIFSNPTGLTRQRFDDSGERLIKRIPEDVMNLIGTLDSSHEDGAGIKLMKAALPFYVASPHNVPDIEFGSYQPLVYTNVVESIGDFDLREASYSLPQRTYLIYGSADFEIPDGTKELKDRPGVKSVYIKDAGHFPFAEKPEEFLQVVGDALQESSL